MTLCFEMHVWQRDAITCAHMHAYILHVTIQQYATNQMFALRYAGQALFSSIASLHDAGKLIIHMDSLTK
jgi:hypothetical protein